MLKNIYTFFLGILIASFVGFGINAFYPPPQFKDVDFSEERVTSLEGKDDERGFKQWQNASREYGRNVSIAGVIIAVILLAVGAAYERQLKVYADGVLLSGVFLLVYGIIASLTSADSKYTFVVTGVALLIVGYLGYHRFIRPETPAKQSLVQKVSRALKK